MLVNEVRKYLDLKDKEEKIKAQLEKLKNSIIYEMSLKNTKVFSEDGVTVKVADVTTFEYKDEPGIIKWLESNQMHSYISKKVNKTALNKELKTSNTLNEGLSTMFAKKLTTSLTVTDDKV